MSLAWRKRKEYLRAHTHDATMRAARQRSAKQATQTIEAVSLDFLYKLALWELSKRTADGCVTPAGVRSVRIPAPPIRDDVDPSKLPPPPSAPVTRSSLTTYDYGQSMLVRDNAQYTLEVAELLLRS